MRKEKVYFVSDNLEIKHEEVSIGHDNFAYYSKKIETGTLNICFTPDEWSRNRLDIERLLAVKKENRIKGLKGVICRLHENIEEIKKIIEKKSKEIDRLEKELSENNLK